MQHNVKSLRPFIGSKDFDTSRQFYTDLGFIEFIIDANLSYFHIDNFGFYLQKAYVADWVDNTMLFLEVDDANRYYDEIHALNLNAKYPSVRLVPVRHMPWGSECFLHDPSGILWHFGHFNQ
jgi:catechol 2,3-dioxygenase-like lactoylglutathione lyase family enzyme